jgi:hypothetical protein
MMAFHFVTLFIVLKSIDFLGFPFVRDRSGNPFFFLRPTKIETDNDSTVTIVEDEAQKIFHQLNKCYSKVINCNC